MRNRLSIIGFSIVALLLFLTIIRSATVANSAQNVTPTFATSRFMLFSGSYQINSGLKKSAGKSAKGVFRIDTYTGATWILKVIEMPDGKCHEQWQLIPNPPVK